MTVLNDLVEALKAETNVPGANTLPDATDADYLLRLKNAFWEAYLDRVIPNGTYDEVGGVVTPDLPRDLQQLVILYAAFNIACNSFMNAQTKFRAHAGPVEYEVEQSASLLKGLLDKMYERKKALIESILAEGGGAGAFVFDNVLARDAAFMYGTSSYVTSWTNGWN